MAVTDPSPVSPPLRSVAILTGLAAALLIAAGLVALPLRSAEPNPLDRMISDVAVLEPVTADGAPRLLTMALGEDGTTVRLTILERDDGAWTEASIVDLSTGQAERSGPLMASLISASPTDIGLVLSSIGQDEPSLDVLVRLRVAGDALDELWRAELPGPTSATGIADVEGDGSPEFVIAETASLAREGCGGTTIRVIPVESGESTTIVQKDRVIIGAAVGRWDTTPGDDLLFYAQDACELVAPEQPAVLAATRLRDGATIREGIALPAQPMTFGAPLRLEVDANSEVDEALIRGSDGLAILDPSLGWMITGVAGSATLPLAATSASSDGGLARVSWIDVDRDVGAASVSIGRSPDGIIAVGSLSTLAVAEGSSTRATLIARQAADLLGAGEPAATLVADLRADGCDDLMLPGAWLPCGSEALEGSAAWIGTRPLTILDDDGDRRLLVASSAFIDRGSGVPSAPTPAATPVDGWWRIGPPDPFTIAELDVEGVLQVPTSPGTVIDPILSSDGTTGIASVAGARLLVRIFGAEEGDGVPPPITPEQVIGPGPPTMGLRGMVRLPVPPGADAADDAGTLRLPIDGIGSPPGTRPSRWAMHAVALDDRGEVGDVVSTSISIDATGPILTIEAPFTSAVWPFPARLTGNAEPGATIDVPGVGELQAGRGGAFEFETTLAPWPQTYVVTARDAAGNATAVELSVVGGIDYRRLPWILIALAAIIVVAGVSAGRSGRRRPVMEIDPAAWPQAEIEELPVEGRSDPP